MGSTKAFSMEQVAEALGVSESTVRRLIAAGDLRAVRVGPRLLRIPATEVDRLLGVAA